MSITKAKQKEFVKTQPKNIENEKRTTYGQHKCVLIDGDKQHHFALYIFFGIKAAEES
jgi:hypothetical protein